MTSAQIRYKLHQFIDNIDDKKVKAIYTIFEDKIEESEYSDQFKAELDKRHKEYIEDGQTVSRQEMNKRLKKILSKSK